MKKIGLFILAVICTLFQTLFTEKTSISATHFSSLGCTVVLLPSSGEFALEFVRTLVKDLQFTKQFTITLKKGDSAPSAVVKECISQKVPFILFLKQTDTVIDWWLYDGLTGSKITAKRYLKRGRVARGWAHQVADMVWKELTGKPGFFGTKITYCKESSLKRGISLKRLCIADYDGTHEQVLVDSKTVLLAPRWHEYAGKPLVFYSEETTKNTRLLSVDLHKNCSVVSSNPGINMLVSFNARGTEAAYSASDQFGYSQIVLVQSRTTVPITSYKANSLGPVIADDGKKIYFYSDFFNGVPQICVYDTVLARVSQITKTGYNFGPSYCSYTGCIAYTGIRNRSMQIFLFEPKSGTHRQLTIDQSQKEDCSWSPAGDFLLVCVTRENAKQLALYNIVTDEYTYITDVRDRCSDPCWSPCYEEFPIVFD